MARPLAAWRTGAVLCREDPMAYMPHPTRFVVIAQCSTVSGTVKQVRRDPVDGELNIMVVPDHAFSQFLLYSNQGLVRTAVVPRDIPKVRVPKVGQHATFYGSWVLDRNQHNQAAMHPVWKIVFGATGQTTRPRTRPRAGHQRLRLQYRRRRVPVGGAIDVLVRPSSSAKGGRRLPPRDEPVFEVRSQDGRGVRGMAATTNALGLVGCPCSPVSTQGRPPVALRRQLGRSAVASTLDHGPAP